jgi:DsbC/DsbD-like thiol-disulfide interchange protein
MKVFELPAETKAATGFTHKAIVDHVDLTVSAADTDQTIALLSVAAGDVVEKAAIKLVTAFADASDAAFNDTQVQVGDGGDTDRFVAATQVNVNGTEVFFKANANTTAFAYTTADTVDLLVESMTAKSLSELDAGELHVYLAVQKLASI